MDNEIDLYRNEVLKRDKQIVKQNEDIRNLKFELDGT